MSTINRPLSYGATDFSARLALVVTSLAALGLGVAIGQPIPTLFGVVGGLFVAWSADPLNDGDATGRVLGGLALSFGSVLLVVGIALVAMRTTLAPTALVACTSFAVVAVGVDTFVGLTRDTARPVLKSLGQSLLVVGTIALLATCVNRHLFRLNAALLADGSTRLLGTNALVSFVILQYELVAAVLLFGLALPRLKRWTNGDTGRLAAAEQFALEPTDISRGVWLFLLAELIVLFPPSIGHWFERFLSTIPVFGFIVRTLLRPWVLHLPLTILCFALASVVVADYVRRGVVLWLGPNPQVVLGYASDGFVACFLALAGTALLPVGQWLGPVAHESIPVSRALVVSGSGATLLWGLAVALACVLGLVFLVLLSEQIPYVPRTAGGFAVGCGLLFAGTLIGSYANVPMFVTFVGVGATLYVWELGRYAVELGHQMGDVAETRRGEVTHAAGGLLVGLAGIGLAAAAAYLVGPASVPQGWRAAAGLGLALVALVAFAFALD